MISNPIKIGLGKLKKRGAKVVSVNPIRTGYSAIADEWIGIRPGTDGLFVLAIVHELLRAGKVDADYLARYTNASWLVVQDKGGAQDGLFARSDGGAPLVYDRKRKSIISALDGDVSPALSGEYVLADGTRVMPSFTLLAARYLEQKYSPENVAERTGVPVTTIRRIAAELAHIAFNEPVVIDRPWTDWAGRRHSKMVGRPISIHAMRGISAHSNGFHTCRALHMLQALLGAIDTPGAWRYEPPYPKSVPPAVKPAGHADPNGSLNGPPLGFPQGPEDLLVDESGKALRIDKAFSWEAPLAAHGMFHTVIANAHRGDPYTVDTLFMYMANMSWNSAMNTAEIMHMLSDIDPATGEHKIPRIIYSDAYYSEMVAYADLVLPDTTYLERYDCISLLDRPISNAEGAGDAIRQPVIKPDRDVRAFQDVLIDLGARLGLPCFVKDGKPCYPGFYPDFMVNHERMPGIGMLAGWRGDKGDASAVGPPNPHQLDRYIDNQCFWRAEIPPEAHFFKPWNAAYLKWAVEMGFLDKPEPIFIQLYSETLQKFRLAARGHGKIAVPEQHRQRVDTYFDPLPIWYMPFEEADAGGKFEFHAITQRPMAMYHSWGSQNAWLRQIHDENFLHINRETATKLGIGDGDWVKLTSAHSALVVPAKLMDGVNPNTVWTWNAIGKRSGTRNLAPDTGESKRGFLLNHLIRDLLPPRADGYRYSNSDPVTGQAAWYDLRVRIEKVAGKRDHSEPAFDTLDAPKLPERPAILRYGAMFREKAKSR